MSGITLYDYWRSSASYRVRLALAVKGLEYRTHPVNLLVGAHKAAPHLQRNPQAFVPVMEIEGVELTQSLAIIDYLEERFPTPALLPEDFLERAQVRALAHALAVDIHPVCNLSIVKEIALLSDAGDEAKKAWMQRHIRRGLCAFEKLLERGKPGRFCFKDRIGLADIVLLPQIYNADRWSAERSDLPLICGIVERLQQEEVLQAAAPREPLGTTTH
ncbi:maleylacetoacetate isomerase [Polycladidibacter hongkongensis]|uniref:maleylacetoacetate isomerase n=1 Tax=Polycladidibacter hongkongensis TaxID=1647556 RepID=UPI000836E00A|nr:maleylacetoacetate isomerase [Pseudovibrio hongkongensis]